MGGVERCFGRLYLCPDCLFHAVGCSVGGMDLIAHILGEFVRRLLVIGAAVHIRLV